MTTSEAAVALARDLKGHGRDLVATRLRLDTADAVDDGQVTLRTSGDTVPKLVGVSVQPEDQVLVARTGDRGEVVVGAVAASGEADAAGALAMLDAAAIGDTIRRGPQGAAYAPEAISADWFSDLNDAVAAAGPGRDVMLSADTTYTQATPIRASASIVGQDRDTSVIQAAAGVWDAGSGRPIVSIIGADAVRIANLTLDGQGAARTGAENIPKFVLVSNASHVAIERVRFTGGGIATTEASYPTGPYIELVAEDVAGDDPASNPDVVAGGVTHALIRDCIFEASAHGYNFAIRLLSNWALDRAPSAFTNRVEGVLIDHNWFLGDDDGNGFGWNTIELAGGGTRRNRATNNHFWGRTLTHIDFDKVTSGNTADHNVIYSAGIPTQHLGSATEEANAIHVHGGGTLAYTTNHNTVAHNQIYNVVNTADTNDTMSAIRVQDAKYTRILHNTIDTVTGADTSATGDGVGILLDKATPDTQIVGNIIRNVVRGIGYVSEDEDRSNIVVRDNDVIATGSAIEVGASSTGTASSGSIVVAGNTAETTAGAYALNVTGGTGLSATISGNTGIGGSAAALRVDVPGAVVTANHLSGGAYGVRAYRTDSRFIGNIATGSTAAFGLSGVTSVAHQRGNSWNPEAGTTAERPSAALMGVGYPYYDTTLNKPIVSDGTSWRDATGAAV